MGMLVTTTVWLLAGAGLAGAIFWAFLSTPESTIWTLGLSALLLLMFFLVVAITVNGTVLAWYQQRWAGAITGGVRRLPAFIGPALLVAVTWWVAGGVVGWVERHQGEISAVFIARLGWSDVTRLFTFIEWAGDWLRWIAGPFVALVWLRVILTSGWRPGWTLVRHGLSPIRLTIATLTFAILAYAPWRYLVPWRPRWIPPDTAELLFVGAKLSLFAVLAAIAVAWIIRTAAAVPGEPARPASPGASEPPATTSPEPTPV